MTEREWLTGTDPARMLAHVGRAVSARKLRLFAVACCRRVWHLLDATASRRAVEVAERHADGRASAQELACAREGARGAVERWRQERDEATPSAAVVLQARQAAACAASGRPARAAGRAARAAGLEEAAGVRERARARVVGAWGSGLAAVPADLVPATWQALSVPAWWAVQAEEAQARKARAAREAAERRGQSELLRELLGNPFQPMALAPDWLRWHDGAVGRVARAIDEEETYEQMPVLGDALEDAGCDDREILDHLRGPGPHVRGCWVLDRILDA